MYQRVSMILPNAGRKKPTKIKMTYELLECHRSQGFLLAYPGYLAGFDSNPVAYSPDLIPLPEACFVEAQHAYLVPENSFTVM